MWDAAQGALEYLLEDEYPTMQLHPQKDRLQVFQTLATFYLRYLKIFRALEEVYDQLVHPQKRRVVHQVLEGVMGRLVELKNEMVELEYSEFHYFDDILQDFKMTPVSEIFQYTVQNAGNVLVCRFRRVGPEGILKIWAWGRFKCSMSKWILAG